jgi:hypothetical protein
MLLAKKTRIFISMSLDMRDPMSDYELMPPSTEWEKQRIVFECGLTGKVPFLYVSVGAWERAFLQGPLALEKIAEIRRDLDELEAKLLHLDIEEGNHT